MFFGRRSTQAESFDLPGRPESEIAAGFRDLDRLNDAFCFAKPFEAILPEWLGRQRCARLDILDLGAGTGSLGRHLSAWAGKQGWDWRFTNLDSNELALKMGGEPRTVAGSVLALPFPDRSFDLVIASQMTHHLSDAEVVRHWQEAWRVTRRDMFICDVHRNPGLYAMLWVGTRWLGIGSPVREDALISVKRGFRLREWREKARIAGVTGAKVWLYYGTRIVLQARKPE